MSGSVILILRKVRQNRPDLTETTERKALVECKQKVELKHIKKASG